MLVMLILDLQGVHNLDIKPPEQIGYG